MDNLFLFSGNSFLIGENMKKLRNKLNIQQEELNVSVFKDMPDTQELIEVCSQVPFMSEQRLVIVKELSLLSAKASADEGKRLADYLAELPNTTILIMCYSGSPDKRRTLYKTIKKLGAVYDYPEPTQAECVSFAIEQAKQSGALLKRSAAEMLVSVAGCDYHTIANETAKLAVYTGGAEIKENHIKMCASKSLEYNVFEMHSLLVQTKSAEAFALLEEILSEGRPEALIGLIAYNLREMYKVRAMLDLNYSSGRIATVLKTRDFIVKRRISECRGFSSRDLRRGIELLSELDFNIKSGIKDAVLSVPLTLVKIYKL